MVRRAIFILVLVALALFTSANTVSLRGVHPSMASDYSGSVFKCVDGTGSFPISKFNDDYCDCRDGSDEPGMIVYESTSPDSGKEPRHVPMENFTART